MKTNPKHLSYVGKLPGIRNSNLWYTPLVYVELVKSVIGQIDLDPYSSLEANKIIGAKRYFSETLPAENEIWKANSVFMNPPYSSKEIKIAVAKFLEEYEKKSFKQAIVLVNNATETKWFQSLAGKCTSLCFTNHRISFWNSDGKFISGNTRGQVFLYFGKSTSLFKKTFKSIGIIL
jgi:hypothetical protein